MADPTTLTVTGKFLNVTGDGADGGTAPDANPLKGTVKISPLVDYSAATGSSPKFGALMSPVLCTFDDDGLLVRQGTGGAVEVYDLTDPSLSPHVGDGEFTHLIEFDNIRDTSGSQVGTGSWKARARIAADTAVGGVVDLVANMTPLGSAAPSSIVYVEGPAGQSDVVVSATPPSDTTKAWVDTSTEFTGVSYWRDKLTAAATGPTTITLGAEPIAHSVIVTVDGLEVDYTLAGTALNLGSLTSGDIIRITYAYATGTPIPAVQVLAADSFNRANSTSSLGSADSGQAWVIHGSGVAWGISSNRAYLATPASALNAAAVIDHGTADVLIQVKLSTIDVNGGPGLCLRATDADNCFMTNSTGLYKREAGANLQVGSNFSSAFVSGDTIRIVAVGTIIKVYRQAASTGAFVEVLSTTSSFHQTSTSHGMRTRTVDSGRLDDYYAQAAA